MKVLIIEPHVSGHHGPYLAWMVEALAKQGFTIKVVTLKDSVRDPSLSSLCDMAASNTNVSLYEISTLTKNISKSRKRGHFHLIKNEFLYWWEFRAWYKEIQTSFKPDVIFLPYLDYCLHAIGILGSPFDKCPWVGLTMRPSFHYQEMGIIAPKPKWAIIRRTLLFRLLKNPYLRKLMTIDEPLATYLSRNKQITNKATFFSEPSDFNDLPEPGDSKKKLGLDPLRKVILLYGGITLRKGLEELLQTLRNPQFPEDVDVVVAGKVSDSSVEAILSESWVNHFRKSGRLKIVNGFIDEKDESILFSAADIVWLGYRNHFNSSGLLVQAANANRPVLACREGVIGWQTRRHNLGYIVNPRNPNEVILAINELLDRKDMRKVSQRNLNSWKINSFTDSQDLLVKVLKSK